MCVGTAESVALLAISEVSLALAILARSAVMACSSMMLVREHVCAENRVWWSPIGISKLMLMRGCNSGIYGLSRSSLRRGVLGAIETGAHAEGDVRGL